MNKRVLYPLIGVAALSSLAAYGGYINNSAVRDCNKGKEVACNRLIDRDNPERFSDQVTNPYFAEKLQLRAEAEKIERRRKVEADLAALKAKNDREREANKAQLEAKAKRQAEEAAFRKEGWSEQAPGIFTRWCTNTCSNAGVIGDNTYGLMEVWARDRAAGDIYAKVNLTQNGVVVGWTNDTLYLSQGQKGVLTFDTYIDADGMQLTEFNARGV